MTAAEATRPHPAIGPAPVQTAEALRARLERRRLALADEIRTYPGPIAGCDQQFNWLLDQLEHVKARLGELDALFAEARSPDELAARLAGFDPDSQPRESYPHDTVHTH